MGGEGRDIDVRENGLPLALALTRVWGSNLQSKYVPLTGIEPKIFQFLGRCSTPTERPAWPSSMGFT